MNAFYKIRIPNNDFTFWKKIKHKMGNPNNQKFNFGISTIKRSYSKKTYYTYFLLNPFLVISPQLWVPFIFS